MSEVLIENIRVRNKELKKGKKTNITTGLVLQGGGMRGIYSMAALMALEECGLGGAFDHVIGASAGAINGAYLLAKQAKLAVTVYLDDISNKKFVDFKRLSKVVDIDYLVDDVLKKHKALDVEKVKNAHSKLHIVLTDYLTGEAHVLTNKDEDIDIMEAIRATAAMPILYNRVIEVMGRGYIDGGVTDAVPLLRAIDMGCTDIVTILTRDPSFRRNRPSIIMRIIERPFLKNYPEHTKNIILAEDDLFNRTMDIIENPDRLENDIRIGVVYPSDFSKMVSRTTKDRRELLECALMSRNDTRNFFNFQPLYDNPFD
ncbi:MAG: patatin family protein [Fidelibacterota bacterium]|nr:MAG: patatin family protein [Candidatus Neomarinimicrobiota bacterium]